MPVFLSATQAIVAEKALLRQEVRRSAEKAIAYVLSRKARLTAQDIATLLELDQRFALNLDRRDLLRLKEQRQPVRRTPLWRFADENYVASESAVKAMKGSDRILASALYCDKYVLPWDFYLELEAMSTSTDFDATRAFLAIGLLRKRGCQYDAARVEPVSARLRATLRRIAADEQAPEILKVEAILFLLLGGHRSDIQPEWIRKIMAMQQDDGRFGRIPYTSLLTARMLLEYGLQIVEKRPKSTKPSAAAGRPFMAVLRAMRTATSYPATNTPVPQD